MSYQHFGFLLLLPLIILTVSDFRTLNVSLFWLIVLAVSSLITSFYMLCFSVMIFNIVANMFLLLLLGSSIVVYLRIKEQKWINPLKRHIGAGDLIFLMALTPLFSLREYTLFLIFASIFSLIWFAVRSVGSSNKSQTIPLVGTMGLALVAVLITGLFIWKI